METLVVATILLIGHALMGAVDGMYLHDLKYALHKHVDSFTEHIAHTLRVMAMIPLVLLLFALNTGGMLLWLAVFVLILDILFQSWDISLERKSRERYGGLSTAEYQIHILSTLFYGAALALALIAKPASAWEWASPLILDTPHPTFVSTIGWVMFIGAILAGLLHLYYLHPKFRAAQS